MAEQAGSLKGQVAVVTGAARGIGQAIARKLAAMGAAVYLVARDQARLEEVARSITAAGGEAKPFAADLLDARAVMRLGETIRRERGRCDVLVNNAAVSRYKGPLHEMPVEAWDELMGTNLRGVFLSIRTLAPLMIERGAGHMINISSLAGHNPLPNVAAYSASKWGLNGLTYSVAEELRQYGIRVSVIAPGSVNTAFGGQEAPSGEAARRIQPDDVARVVEMLVMQAPQSFVSEVLLRPTRKS